MQLKGKICAFKFWFKRESSIDIHLNKLFFLIVKLEKWKKSSTPFKIHVFGQSVPFKDPSCSVNFTLNQKGLLKSMNTGLLDILSHDKLVMFGLVMTFFLANLYPSDSLGKASKKKKCEIWAFGWTSADPSPAPQFGPRYQVDFFIVLFKSTPFKTWNSFMEYL